MQLGWREINMNSIIICRTNQGGNHNFYLNHKGKDYYLFTQEYLKGVNSRFSSGISLDKALAMKNDRDYGIRKVASKLSMYIKYIEKENNIAVLKSTCNKGALRKRFTFNIERDEVYAY